MARVPPQVLAALSNTKLARDQSKQSGEVLTLQISTLFLPKPRTRILHPRRQRDLNIFRHGLVSIRNAALLLRLAHHRLDPLNRLLAVVERTCDLLREPLNHRLFLPARILVPEPRQQVLLVQFVEVGRFLRNVRQQFRHLVLHVDPARGQHVHFNHGVAIVFEAARVSDQPPAFLGVGRGVGEAIGRADESWLLGWVVCERLAIGDVSKDKAC